MSIEDLIGIPVWDYDPYPAEILGCKLVQTCGACPEQYDVFLDEKQIGYLRLRYGYFRAEYPDCGFQTVYTANPEGDGIFMAHEREKFLTEAIKALLSRHNQIPS